MTKRKVFLERMMKNYKKSMGQGRTLESTPFDLYGLLSENRSEGADAGERTEKLVNEYRQKKKDKRNRKKK